MTKIVVSRLGSTFGVVEFRSSLSRAVETGVEASGLEVVKLSFPKIVVS